MAAVLQQGAVEHALGLREEAGVRNDQEGAEGGELR
jgi:hypothetical protein